MTYPEVLKYPLKLMKLKYGQKVVIYSLVSVFILLTITQNINLFFPSVFDIEKPKIEYSILYKSYIFMKILLYDILVISSCAWFLHKYKFCVISLTSFYAIIISRLTWSFMTYSNVECYTIDLTTTCILNFAWLTIIIYKINRI